MNPAERLVEVANLLEGADPPEDSSTAWFARGVRRWLACDADTLDESLDLGAVGPGKDSARGQYLKNQRNRHLRAAHALCEGDSPWARSGDLERKISRFRVGAWLRWRDLAAPPPGCPEVYWHLFYATKAGKLPDSRNGLHDICG